MAILKDLANSYSRRRFACLFFSLLVTLAAAPVFAALGFSTTLMSLILAFNILAAVFITMFSFGSYAGLGLLVLVLASKVGHTLLGYQGLQMTSQGGAALTCLVSILVMLRHVLREGRVDSERIFAALNVYLMMGIMCGLLFYMFEERWPGSFAFQGSSFNGGNKIEMAHTIYFSFVSLGTLGYGDFIPISGPARALAVFEAIGGQIYLVVVVARLVSLYRGSAEPSDKA